MPWQILLFYVFLLLFYVPNVTKYSYHETVSFQLYSKHKSVVVSAVWDHIVSSEGSSTAKNGRYLGIFIIICVSNIQNCRYFHTDSLQLYAK